jgi:hypothetical protein
MSTEMPPGFSEPQSDAPEKDTPALKIFTAVLVVGLIVFLYFLFRSDNHHGGIGGDAYNGLVKSIREHEGFEPKDVALKHDDGVNDSKGDQYSGEVTKPDGQKAPITVWVQEYSNAQGRGYAIQYLMKKGTPEAAAGATQPANP